MSVAPEPMKKVLRTVTKPYRSRADSEMNAIGWLLFLGLLFVLIPLLPILVALWVVTTVWDYLSGQWSSDTE